MFADHCLVRVALLFISPRYRLISASYHVIVPNVLIFVLGNLLTKA